MKRPGANGSPASPLIEHEAGKRRNSDLLWLEDFGGKLHVVWPLVVRRYILSRLSTKSR